MILEIILKYRYCGVRIYRDFIKFAQIISNFTFLHAHASAPQGNLSLPIPIPSSVAELLENLKASFSVHWLSSM